jgi:hypothetical protein
MTIADEDDHPMARRECEIIPLRVRRTTSPMLDRGAQGQIGEQLRAMYEALAEAPIPARLLALLGRLEHVEGTGDDR